MRHIAGAKRDTHVLHVGRPQPQIERGVAGVRPGRGVDAGHRIVRHHTRQGVPAVGLRNGTRPGVGDDDVGRQGQRATVALLRAGRERGAAQGAQQADGRGAVVVDAVERPPALPVGHQVGQGARDGGALVDGDGHRGAAVHRAAGVAAGGGDVGRRRVASTHLPAAGSQVSGAVQAGVRAEVRLVDTVDLACALVRGGGGGRTGRARRNLQAAPVVVAGVQPDQVVHPLGAGVGDSGVGHFQRHAFAQRHRGEGRDPARGIRHLGVVSGRVILVVVDLAFGNPQLAGHVAARLRLGHARGHTGLHQRGQRVDAAGAAGRALEHVVARAGHRLAGLVGVDGHVGLHDRNQPRSGSLSGRGREGIAAIGTRRCGRRLARVAVIVAVQVKADRRVLERRVARNLSLQRERDRRRRRVGGRNRRRIVIAAAGRQRQRGSRAQGVERPHFLFSGHGVLLDRGWTSGAGASVSSRLGAPMGLPPGRFNQCPGAAAMAPFVLGGNRGRMWP